MRVARVELTDSAVAELALLLQRAGESESAVRVGLAADTVTTAEVPLIPHDLAVIRRLLERRCPPSLEPLREELSQSA